MTATGWTTRSIFQALALALPLAFLVACGGGRVRRVSEPAAQIQQLTVRADGRWAVDLRIENFSSIPMRFEKVDLGLTVGGHEAGRVTAQPAVSIGPESGDVITAVFTPQAAGKLAVADALASGRGISYKLEGHLEATPDEGRLRRFEIERSSQLSPAPGLPGVMR